MAVHLLLLLLTTLLSAAAADEQTQTAAHSKHYEKHHHHHHHHHSHNFRPTSLFVFGDSYVDTKNSKNKGIPNAWKSPYGSTFPGKPAGRFSNGRVLTDFFARYMGLKSPLTYKMRNMVTKKILRRGMNFAVGGAGVFDTFSGIPNVSTQIDHFDDLIKHKVYTSVDLNNSVTLFSVAGNDYGYHVAHTGFEDLPSFIESVVNETSQNLMRIHALGVKRIVVSGLHLLGCIPSVTTKFAFTQCNDTLNNFITLHNRLLNQHIVQLN